MQNVQRQKSLVNTQGAQPKFTVFMKDAEVQSLIARAVGKNAQRFTAAVISAVTANPDLQKCQQHTVLSAALLGESLNLSPSPQLGQYYLVPFKKKDREGNVVEVNAQFILGAKGYKQLAMRSGQYADIDVLEIKEGEYKGRDKHTGKQLFEFIEDDEERDSLPTVGYMAYFELLNGFRKVVYWTKSKMIQHAATYSQAFDASKYDDYVAGKIPQNQLYKYSSFWYKNFDEMAFKTLIKHLLSHWGILSIEMQEAITHDDAVIREDGEPIYNDVPDAEQPTYSVEGEQLQDSEVSESGFDFFGDPNADVAEN